MRFRVIVVVATVAVTTTGAVPAPAAERVPSPGAAARTPLEEVEPVPSRLQPGTTERRPPAKVDRDGFVSVQVNVDGDGLDVLGDAANEPSLVVDPTAPLRIAIGWRQFDTVASSFRQAGRAFSVDGGRSWTAPPPLTPGTFRSDPVLAAASDGTMYYYSLVPASGGNVRCDLFVSGDGGATWGPPIRAFGGDKAWLAVDRSGGLGDGTLYASWSLAANPWGERIFTRSTDGGATFSDPIVLTPAPIWGTVVVGPEGEVYIAGNASFTRDVFVLQRSLDAHDPLVAVPTFDPFVFELGGDQLFGGDIVGDSPNPGGLLGQVWLDVDRGDGPDRGTLYAVASVDPPGPDPMDVHLVRSDDRGETWSLPTPVTVDDRGAWQWFATMSVAPTGRVDVVWVESLDGVTPNLGELYWTSSEDGGRSWGTPVAVSPSFDSHLGWPSQSKLGDYFHMVSDAVGAHLAYAATFNGGQDVYYLRLGDTDCDGNAVADGDDLVDGRLADCDGDGLLDRCEIAAGTLADADLDGVADVCTTPRRPAGRVGG